MNSAVEGVRRRAVVLFSRMHFGSFDFDPVSGELAGPQGVNRLAPQVSSVLRILTERAGDVVTRAELRDALWPDTTVEFDQGLNFCIRQLRIALGDDADAPTYIETLPRRGYRFIVPIGAGLRVAQPATGLPRRRGKVATVIAGAAIVAGLVGWVAERGTVRPNAHDDRRSLAVIAFDAPAGDSLLASYSARLAEELVSSITQAHMNEIAVMGPSFTRRFPGARTPPDSVRVALGATHVLSGTLRRAEGGIRVFAQLIRLDDRRHMMAVRLVDTTAGGLELRAIADSIARQAAKITIALADR